MKMEVVLSSPGHYDDDNNTPYKNEEIHEWSGVDEITGMLENARVETGRWQAFDNNSAKSYGKVVDSRIRNSADGSVTQKARRQVEIYQSNEPGRSVQVVKASHWSSSRITDNQESFLSSSSSSSKLRDLNYQKINSITRKSPTKLFYQKRFNSDEDLSLSSSSDPSTSTSIFTRNSQIRRSLQIPTTNNNDIDKKYKIDENNEIKINKNDEKIYMEISTAMTGSKNSSITIKTPTIKINKKPQITVINLINPSSIYNDDKNIKKTSIITLKPLENKNQLIDDNKNNKIIKKVDFCKTEIHFAADCGKVNIVETINKPPPTNKYRRKRRNNNNNNININNNNNNNNLDTNLSTNDDIIVTKNSELITSLKDNYNDIIDDDSGAYAVVDLETKKYWNNDIDNFKLHTTKIKLGDEIKVIDELTSPKAVLEINSRVKNINNNDNVNIVTKDNDNNQVLSTIVKTHETIIARVEDNLPIINKKKYIDNKKFKNDKINQKLPIYANVFNNINDKFPVYENYRIDNSKKIKDNFDKNIKIDGKKIAGILDRKNSIVEKKLVTKSLSKVGKKSPGNTIKSSSSSGSKKDNVKDLSKIKGIKKTSIESTDKKHTTGTVKKPVEVVYKTAVYNMKNEKLVNKNKTIKTKDTKTGPRIIDELICGSKSKNLKTINKRKGTASQSSKGVTQAPRHWK